MRTANDNIRIPVHAVKKTVDYRTEVFLHQSKQYMFQNQNNNKKYCFYEDNTITDRTSYSYR